MTNPNKTLIVTILDRSGSMQSIRTDMQGAFDAFIAEQRKEAGEAEVTLVQFDNRYEVVYKLRPLAEVPQLVLAPRGSTALFDAIGRTINEVGRELATLLEGDRPGTVVFVIITDGLENASVEFKAPQIKAMIEHQTAAYSWVFTYLGANQDAVLVAQSMGIVAANALTYSPSARGTRAGGQALSGSVSVLRRTGFYRGYSDAQRKEAVAT